MSEKDGEAPKDIFKKFRSNAAAEFNKQYQRTKRQDWWTFSKMIIVFSGLLISISFIMISGMAIYSEIQGVEPPLLVSIISLIVAIRGVTFYTLVGGLLAGLASSLAIATGNQEFTELETKRPRYLGHAGKLVVAIFLFASVYQIMFSDQYMGVIEMITIMFGMTGLLLLPFGLFFWGIVGIWKERDLE